jgi:hypothetical protein
MISRGYSFKEFAEAMQGKNPQEIIYLAEKEATEAWRAAYRHRQGSEDWFRSKSYQDRLIGLIDFMRHGVNTFQFDEQDLYLCRMLHPEAPTNRHPQTP